MSVHVVARIRPLLGDELEKDEIVEAVSPTDIRIPSPKNGAESFSFHFNSVYGQQSTQQELFDNEVAPTVKQLYNGIDVTIFAYGVTGTGKTHTMRGGKALADRGVIPRLLSAIHRRGRKVEKDSDGQTQVEVTMSYYEIYNDRVFDLLEPPEKRTPAGLPIRDNNGKTVVAGLSERPCTSLREFEVAYDQANMNRSTSATKLNAHSSRSHAILCVKVSQVSASHTIVSTASAIDLAGSEDNRRTGNGKERLVESSSINKSLFVLSQCVEAINQKKSRIPYRESKMTRILALGQNNGFTLMILNLASCRAYHLDTLSSLNFSNRTKKVEIREAENEPIFHKMATKPNAISIIRSSAPRQPLRPITSTLNIGVEKPTTGKDKPLKSFAVYAEKNGGLLDNRKTNILKRSSDGFPAESRPTKVVKREEHELSRADIESLVDRMVEEKLANRALANSDRASEVNPSAEVQRRLESLEQRVEKKEDGRAEGLQFLLMAKQHHVRGEETSALKMYRLALPFFPDNEKLARKMLVLQEKIRRKRDVGHPPSGQMPLAALRTTGKLLHSDHDELQADSDGEYKPTADDGDDEFIALQTTATATDTATAPQPNPNKTKTHISTMVFRDDGADANPALTSRATETTPRTASLLRIINSRDIAAIKSLKGVGAKKAEAIVNSLCLLDEEEEDDDDDKKGARAVRSLEQLGGIKGVGAKTVENMRLALTVSV